MTDNHDYLGVSDAKSRLKADVLALMLRGAGYAFMFCLCILVVAWIFVGIASVLPDASKTAPDPTPNSSLIGEQAEAVRVA